MYYIVRTLTFVLCILIIAVIFLLIRKFAIKHRKPDFNEKYATDKVFRRKVIIRSICIYIVFIVLMLLCTYPVECHIITFDSVEDSLAYKNISTENITIYESEKTVFIADEDKLKLYSVTKVGDKFSTVDFQCENCNYYEPKSINSIIKQPTKAKFNKATGETFYYIRITPRADRIYENVTLDNQKMQLATVDNAYDFITEAYQKAPAYYFIDTNPPKENFKFDTIDYSTTFKLS